MRFMSARGLPHDVVTRIALWPRSNPKKATAPIHKPALRLRPDLLQQGNGFRRRY